MLRAGVLLTILGFGSVGFHYWSDRQLAILIWAEDYQPALGSVIGVLGLALVVAHVVLSKRKQQPSAPQQAFPQQAPQQPFQAGQPPQQPFPQPGQAPQQFPQQQFPPNQQGRPGR
ncbi:hypothetical protein [Amycolatopsis sp. CA-230715]|uniref:hypothetical protein n=1 Tax=Amycolatopsis sp. CA-230715 TaxID=2745196 RepID=UPI001C02B47A|nr:hypothetical protein [Amycolatopsis sp. CA-230715]QWF78078.1 hypothetical protein HUW46_01473 [Amycolatopsis sp. CA-230715]